MAHKTIISIDWKACDAFPQAPTDQHTEYQIKKASIPLVFVPGIMGSRLERSNGRFAWDPDDQLNMWLKYHEKSGQNRKQLLIDDPNENGVLQVISMQNGSSTAGFEAKLRDIWLKKPWFGAPVANAPKWTWLPPATAKLQGEELVNAMVKLAVKQGWVEVAWGFYGDFLLALAQTKFQEFKRIFHHPVYAVGYNWVKDNKLAGDMLTARITEIKQTEQSYGRECEKVILISHSMGGLVTRASVVPGVASACSKANVLGVIHGAQPATGAPAAYRRMRAGFESRPTDSFMDGQIRGIMGASSAQVVPVLAGCVGGLELLPTKLYSFKKDGKNESSWLEQIEHDGSVGESLPKNNDPYSEIYREDKDFLRLVYDPKLLDPGAQTKQAAKKHSSADSSAQSQFARNIGAAEAFHDLLKDQTHDATFIAWGGDHGMATFERITYRFESLIAPNDLGSGSDLDSAPPDGSAPSYFRIDGPNGPGDQTVPASSGSALLHKSMNADLHNAECKPVSGETTGFEHSTFYNDPKVRDFVYAAVQELSFQFREDKIGR